jgi:hypothetical protein
MNKPVIAVMTPTTVVTTPGNVCQKSGDLVSMAMDEFASFQLDHQVGRLWKIRFSVGGPQAFSSFATV